MFKNIKGILTFEVVAPDINKFINILKDSCITTSSVEYRNGKIIGNIYNTDFKELKQIAEMCNAQLSILKRKGAVFTVQKYKKRLGLLIGFILSFFMIVYLSDVVMIIEIYGNQTISDKEVISLLNDAGIHIGSSISNQDLRKVERMVVASSEKISWAGLRSSGCKIQIEIREMDTSPDVVQKNIPCNIVSAKDAQIVAIKNVYTGMLVQMLNNGVKKGDLLISGTFEDGKGGVYYVHSMGEIIGRYDEKIVIKQPLLEEKAFFSEEYNKKTIHFFGLKIPLSLKQIDFEQYELDEEISYLKFSDIQLPMGIINSKYQPYETQIVQYSEEQAKLILMDKISMYEYNFLNNDDLKVIDKHIKFEVTNDAVYAIVKHTVEGNIGISKEILVK